MKTRGENSIRLLNRPRLVNKNRLLGNIRLLNKPGFVNRNSLLDKLERLNSLRPADSINKDLNKNIN